MPFFDQQKFGVMTIVLPPRKQRIFHRINAEYLLSLRSMNKNHFCMVLREALMANLDKSHHDAALLKHLNEEIFFWADEMIAKQAMLNNGLNRLRSALSDSHNVNFLEASLTARQASRKMASALYQPGAFSQQALENARQMLLFTLKINAYDYRALFELGWLYLFVFDRIAEAEFYFDAAATYSEEIAPQFSVFALRHLADTRYSLGEIKEALCVIEKAIQLAEQSESESDVELYYEYARYLAKSGQPKAAAKQLSKTVKHNALYYLQAQSEPDFQEETDIAMTLEILRLERIKAIKTSIDLEWSRHPFRHFDLPADCNPNRFHLRTVNAHINELEHASFLEASQIEQPLRQRIKRQTLLGLTKELANLRRRCRLRIFKQRRTYSWLNKMGGYLLQTSLIMIISVVFFNAYQLLNWFLGSGEFIANRLLILQIFAIASITTVIGVGLMFYDSQKTRKMRRHLGQYNQAFRFLNPH